MSTIESIRTAVRSRRPGTVISAASILGAGSREAVDQALGRLARSGELMRIARGKYVRPQSGRFGSYPPPATKVIKSLAKAQGKAIVESGAVSANRLGLTTQQPVRQVFMTTGKSGELKLGNNPILLRHVPAWQTMFANRPAGQALRALAYMGKAESGEAAKRIKGSLEAAEWEALMRAKKKFPAWVSKALEGAA